MPALLLLGAAGSRPAMSAAAEAALTERLSASRPSSLPKLPPDFRQRVGATHVAGKYGLTTKPFLVEGAEKLLQLGATLGKFWFMPGNPAASYPFHSRWPTCKNFVDLARTDYFRQVFDLPFKTILLEAHTPAEEGWRKPNRPASFYEGVTQEFRELTAHLYQSYGNRDLTFVLQHWEGDWMLRGSGEKWTPPPPDWRQRCEAMTRWLAARQAGVSQARADASPSAKCVVAHAAEVNRVADIWKKIPTMTDQVLPEVTLDLVSYSCYDGMKDALTLWHCLAEIRRHCRTGALFGPGAVMVGEIGIPENDAPQRVTERWDELMGAMLAAEVKYIAQWELYCNEFSQAAAPRPATPIKDPRQVRGFWLVKPDGSLSETGQYFRGLWQRAGAA